MSDETTDSPTPDSDHQSHDFHLLVMKGQESGDWRPVIEWLAGHPGRAGELADFLARNRWLQGLVAPLSGSPVIEGLELLEEIGRGTFGVVYRARDSLKREVAVKVVPTAGEADRDRFRFEAEAAAGLDHPNVVPVTFFGESRGVPYLVMPYLPGGSLAGWLRLRGTDLPPPRQAAQIVRDVALGTYHAHQRGLIHRDLKPGNVLLDANGTPRIADFGLARRVDASVSGAAGTPAYMAPEQARGERRLTTAADVYALGVILFELLTGRTPFGGEDLGTFLRRLQNEPAPLVRSLRPEAPAALEEVCARCLAEEPEDRYPSALELAADLDACLKGERIGKRSGRWWGRMMEGIERRVETDSMANWYVLVWNAASVVAAMAGLQTAVALSMPWLAWAAVAFYLLAWGGVGWVLLLVRWGRLNSVERNSGLVQLGMVAGCAACLPAYGLPSGEVVRVLPAFLAVKGLGIFVHGQWYWGWMYVAGATYFALAASMPLIPPEVWPVAFGLCSGGFQFWAAMHLRRIHRQGGAP